MNDGDGDGIHPAGYASPPCLMHEMEAGGSPDHLPADDAAWRDVARWRKAERARLIEARLAIFAGDRAGMASRIAAGLDAAVGELAGRTVSLYWPFRGEPDLRPWMSAGDFAEAGAWPFRWSWKRPGRWSSGPMRPATAWRRASGTSRCRRKGETVLPDIVIAPLVGVDPGRYRLGYGGGFFDRTLASLPRKPLVIGVGYEMQRIATIYPQEHDIPMDLIVTEAG